MKTITYAAGIAAIFALASSTYAATVMVSVDQAPGTSASYDLTAIGTTDWVKLGSDSAGGAAWRNEKSDTSFIGTVTVSGTGASNRPTTGGAFTSSWTDGTVGAPMGGATGTDVALKWETRSSVNSGGGATAYNFSVSGLDAGDYSMTLMGSKFQAIGTLTATIGAVSDSALFDVDGTTGGTAHGIFTIDFTIGTGETMDVVYSKSNVNNTSTSSENIGIHAITLAAIPEPSAFTLLGLGLGALMFRRRRS